MSSEQDSRRGEKHSAGPCHGTPQVSAGGWKDKDSDVRWKDFAVLGAAETLRVHFCPSAYADLIAHAKQDLSSEVCGVLAGEVCQDEQGDHVSILAIVRGNSVHAGASHVTYTQDTWNEIHETMERYHPKLTIVGWYHSHPGFGVEFSDMDLFIHENFFSGRGQIAFVTDPLGGDEAICFKTSKGVARLERFWVGSRERRCRATSKQSSSAPTAGAKELQAIEDRLAQALQAIEALRNNCYHFLTFMGALLALGVVFWISDMIYSRLWADLRPPEVKAFLPGAVKIGNEWHWIGASVVTQRLRPEAEQKYREAEQEALAAEQAAKAAATGRPQSQPASDQPQETAQP